ncbi:uncharacterized protein LOC126853505 [Cataglyphis hispanica]|uniref:uncharacterized protein LOC126853505 n=1 Tax=Cataglyphis hispanica TaxID=1086592 RepID=UPI0021808196|nr:uncharacterized protein LOC126853505 [Cataglyphis hispanica]
MYIDKVLLTIAFCATSAWCNDRTSTRNARTIDLSSSFLTWPRMLFRNRLSIFMKKFWPRQFQLQEWTRSGVANLLRFVHFGRTGQGSMRIEFRPEDGPRAAEMYQRRFGYRGEWLIEQLGNGLGPNVRLDRLQPVPNTFLTPPIPFLQGFKLKY